MPYPHMYFGGGHDGLPRFEIVQNEPSYGAYEPTGRIREDHRVIEYRDDCYTTTIPQEVYLSATGDDGQIDPMVIRQWIQSQDGCERFEPASIEVHHDEQWGAVVLSRSPTPRSVEVVDRVIEPPPRTWHTVLLEDEFECLAAE